MDTRVCHDRAYTSVLVTGREASGWDARGWRSRLGRADRRTYRPARTVAFPQRATEPSHARRSPRVALVARVQRSSLASVHGSRERE